MREMISLYNLARLEASKIYDREKLAEYWKEKLEWFKKQESTSCDLAAIIEACAAHYEIHS